MDATTLLDYAYKLSDDESCCECSYRNAAGRAYYAAYHAVIPIGDQCLPPLGSERRGGVHQLLIDSLQNGNAALFGADNPKVASLAYIMKSIKDIRVHADYGLDEPFEKKDRDSAIKQANRLFERVSEIVESIQH